jgi:hypothetical protein
MIYRFEEYEEERPGGNAHRSEPPLPSRLSSLTEPDEGQLAAMQSLHHRPQGGAEHRFERALEVPADKAPLSTWIPPVAGRR